MWTILFLVFVIASVCYAKFKRKTYYAMTETYEFYLGGIIFAGVNFLFTLNPIYLALGFLALVVSGKYKHKEQENNIGLGWLFLLWFPLSVVFFLNYQELALYNYPLWPSYFGYLIIFYALDIYFKPLRVSLCFFISLFTRGLGYFE